MHEQLLQRHLPQIIDDLAARGWSRLDNVLPATLTHELAEECRKRARAGALNPAGVGRGQGLAVREGIRGDSIQWLEHGQSAPSDGYLQAMDPSFVGLTGSPEEIQAVSREFKVFYQKVETPSGGYTIDHTAGSYIFDPKGQVRLFARYGMPLDQLTADVRQLLDLPAVGASAAQ